MLIAGIDWADDHHEVHVLAPDGRPPASFRVPHQADGLAELGERLRSLAGSPENVACIVETRHGLLVTSLLEAGFAV